jgi:tripartite-type tricarboxylate transporter receptor subunit TctC
MRYAFRLAAAVLGLLAFAAPVLAQQYPDRIVTIIVPYPAGGPTDRAV